MTKHEYQVVARCTDPSHPGASTLIYTAHAVSIQEATAKVQKLRIDTMTPGLYRITQVTSASRSAPAPSPASAGSAPASPGAPRPKQPRPRAPYRSERSGLPGRRTADTVVAHARSHPGGPR